MNIRNLTLSLAIALGCSCAAAQEVEGTTEYVFNPHWYVQGQFGGQETLGEDSFGKLLSLNAQIGGGYQFNPLFGARVSLNSWKSKEGLHVNNSVAKINENWKWSYIAPMADVTFDLSNLIGGYNPTRLVDVNLFAGLGANFAFKNGEAVAINDKLKPYANGEDYLQNIWDGTKTRFVVRFGAAVDFRITQNWAVGLELQANTLNDNYNSKRAGNADWYFNGYAGVKYTFGKTHSTRFVPATPTEPQVVIEERVVEKIVEVPVEIKPSNEYIRAAAASLPMTRNVFFTISNSKISLWEMQKVKEIAEYLEDYPDATVKITGYADKGTGSKAINLRLSKQRAEVVKNALVKDFGISADRITTESMTYDEPDQPFKTPALNRVAICVASCPDEE